MRSHSAEVRLGIVVSLIAVLGFTALGLIVFLGPGQSFDAWFSQTVARGRTSLLTALFEWFTFLGNTDTLVVVGILLLLAASLHRPIRFEALCVVGLLTAVGITNCALKSVFARPRPDLALRLLSETSWSFPSGHSMVSLCLFGFLGYVAATRMDGWRRTAVAAIAVAFIALIGFSRIYLGVHYACDVLAGYLAGLPVLVAGILTYRAQSAVLPEPVPVVNEQVADREELLHV